MTQSSFPVDLPVALFNLVARTHSPFPRKADTLWVPERSWNRNYGWALHALGCQRAQQGGASPCPDHGDRLRCRQPESCQLCGIYKPYSDIQRRSFSRPIWLRCDERGKPALPAHIHHMMLTLWGHRAVAMREVALQALNSLDASIEVSPLFEGKLGQCIEWLFGPASAHGNRLFIELPTPFSSESLRKLVAELRESDATALPPSFPIDLVLRSTARELVAWDHEERGATASEAQEAVEAAEREVAAIVKALRVCPAGGGELDVELLDAGRFGSRGNGGRYRLQGVVASFDLSGDLEPALPWLAAAIVGGSGRRRIDGLGQVQASWIHETDDGYALPEQCSSW